MALRSPRPSTWLKLVVSVALLAYVFAKVGWGELWTVLSDADLGFILLSLALIPVLQIASVLKWQVLLRAKQLHISFGRLWAVYLVGYFFNNLLPSNVGGDAVRSYQLGKQTGDLREAVASVFVERASGFFCLLALALTSVALRPGLLEDPRVALALAVAFAGFGSLLVAVLDTRVLSLCRRLLPHPILARWVHKAGQLQEAIRSYRGTRLWWRVSALTVLFYLLAILNVYVGCLAFSATPPLFAIGVAMPVILVISMIPISIAGIGLQEWSYYVIFEQVGLPGALGLSVALLMRAKAILAGGVGGIFYARALVRDEKSDEFVPA